MKLRRSTRWTVLVLVVMAMLVVSAGCPAPNQAPAITSLSASPASVAPGGSSTITCVASDPDGDTLTYAWSATGGTISGTGSAVTWVAPGVEGTFTISVTVDDGNGGTDTDSLDVVVAVVNNPPLITSLSASLATVAPGGSSTITCVASDPDGDTLTYTWSASGGTISGTGSSVTWVAPGVEGTYNISVTVDDGRGGTDTSATPVVVAVITGSIDVSSNPAGAAIYLDGVDTGNITPYIITNVPQGSHTIRLTYWHYKDRQETVMVNAGETTYINWALTYASTQTVTLQPDPALGKDAHVEEVIPDTNLGSSTSIWVGEWSGGQPNRSYLQFDLSSIPPTAVVLNAELGLYYHMSSAAVSVDVGAYRVTGSWSEGGITWNNQPTSAATAEDTRTVPATATSNFRYWDLSDLVQGWIDGSIENYGAMLRDADETTTKACKGFWSSDYATANQRPKLEISYYDPADP